MHVGVRDELLEMQRRMNKRLQDLMGRQADVIGDLERRVADTNEILRAVGEVVRV